MQLAHSDGDNKIYSQQKRLEEIFYAIDQIKKDLGKCGMNMSDLIPIITNPEGMIIMYKKNPEDEQIQITYKYNRFSKTISRKTSNQSKYYILLANVSDFFVTHFPEAKSVLYRIEVGGKEQIRGYIFLLNVK